MASQHHGTFTWGPGPNSVHVAGGFNSWSDTATPLVKQADGTFKADVPMPWGQKQAFKYIVDGEWKVREDEAKEWDAAGNMNNVYTAPHEPASTDTAPSSLVKDTDSTPAPVPAPIPVPAAVTDTSKSEAAPVVAKEPSAPVVDATPVPEPAPVAAKTNPLASLGKPVGGSADPAAVTEVEKIPAPAALPAVADVTPPKPSEVAAVEEQSLVRPADKETAPVVVPLNAKAPVAVPTKAEEIERTAASAPIGESSTAEHEEGVLEKAAAFGATALAGLTAVAGTAAVQLEKVTGIDLAHGNPLSVEEARAKGIDVDTLPEHEIKTDTVSPVGIPPSKAAVADLEEKVNALKVDDSTTRAPAPVAPAPVPATATGPSSGTGVAAVPLPATAPPKRSEVEVKAPAADNQKAQKHDLPAQSETGANHKTVPAPQITDLTEKDPRHDRSLQGSDNIDSIATKPISSDPSVSAQDAKKDAESHPGLNGSTGSTAQTAQTQPAQDKHTYATSGTASTPVKGPAATGPLPAGSAVAASDAKEANHDAPPPVKKDTAPSATKPVTAPATPPKAKANGGAPASASTPAPAGIAAPGSINSTPASTPAKSTHAREGTSGSDIRKRKSSFFHKIKSAFSPKDKKEKEAK